MIFEGSAVEGVDLHFRLGRGATLDAVSGQDAGPPNAIDTGDGQTAEMNWLTRGDVASSAAAGALPEPPLSRGDPAAHDPVLIDGFSVTPAEGAELVTEGAALVTMVCRSLVHTEVAWGFAICTSDLATNIATCTLGLEGLKRRVKVHPGVNEFHCRIPRLPLCPGVYAIRGSIADGTTLTSIAHRGFENRPDYFSVTSREATPHTNVQSILNDLVTIKVEWMD